ncbi:hypothetical protein [Halomonas lysinitropha]|uniref:Uncharacterized protein n=1 Tax=Halomonas lysinitropha TaxID=2607506 RepID=A0A5K1I8Y2_9GAMM|nr:hypothetical protein [Halomonas lysinitropha]VVZ95532.1 hypothetical protein HALO32_01603 [Halomonas lysinitropha]
MYGYDAVILDHSLNDLVFYSERVGQYKNILARLYDFIFSLNIPCLVIGFQPMSLFLSGGDNNIIELIRSEALSRGFYFFDFNSEMLKLLSGGVDCYKKFFMDDTHPKREVAFEVGGMIADELFFIMDHTPFECTGVRERYRNSSRQAFPFYFVGNDDVENGFEGFKVESSIVSVSGFKVEREWLEVKAASAGVLIGIFLDSRNSYGFIEFSSEGGGVVKNLVFKGAVFRSDNSKPLVWFRPINTSLEVRGSFVVRCRESGCLSSGYEETPATIGNLKKVSLFRPQVSVVGFLVMC